MQDNPTQYTQLIGSDRPGVEVTAITDVKLSNTCLTFIPALSDDLKYSTLPQNSKGIIEEISSAICRLSFRLNDPAMAEECQVMFWIKRRDFDRFFAR